jgi:glutamyl-tRNA reductase
MNLVVVGVNHRSAPIEVREKLAFCKRSLHDVLCRLKEDTGLWECGIISTCNRVEVYGAGCEEDSCLEAVKNFLSRQCGQPRPFFEPSLYLQKQPESVRHIFRVASGLDAMIVGEKEIVAQVKEAYEKAVEAGSVGPVLNALFQRALRVSKRVRTETRIDVGAVSVSSAAVDLAKKIFGELSGKTVMIIGAGQVSELTVKHLVDDGAGSIIASNRSFDKAEDIARRYGGNAVRLDNCVNELAKADIAISSTAAPGIIIHKEQIREAMRKRHHRPMFLIDIAVPRDIDPLANDIDNVYLYNIDDLKAIADANLRKRREETIQGERIIEEEVASFMGWLDSLQATPLIRKLREHFESVRVEELKKAFPNESNLSKEVHDKLDVVTRRMIKKLLHVPTTRIKKVAREKEGVSGLALLNDVFGLDEHKKEGK